MEDFKIALVGCGRVAQKHLKAINYLNRPSRKRAFRISLSHLVDPNREAAEVLADAYTGVEKPLICRSLDQVFGQSSDPTLASDSGSGPDLVAITTPSGLHFQQAKLALDKDCHVLVEKPICLKLAEADKLVSLAENRGKKIVVGHIYRYFPILNDLVRDLRSGLFGKPLYGVVQVRWGHDQAYYNQADWRGSWELDGGAVMNQSIHGLDLVHWLLGEPDLISARGCLARQSHAIEAEDLGLGIFEFADNIWLNLEGTTNTDPNLHEASFFVRYTGGEIRARLLGKEISLSIRDKAGRELKYAYLWRYLRKVVRKQGFSYLGQLFNPHTGIYLDLAESILEDRHPLAPGQCGRTSLDMVLALYRSDWGNAGPSPMV